MTDNVIDLSERKKLTIERYRSSGCRCSQLTINEQLRTLYCKVCCKHFDAFDFLLKKIKERDFSELTIEHLKSNIKELEEKLTQLKNEERNIKARLKRARGANE